MTEGRFASLIVRECFFLETVVSFRPGFHVRMKMEELVLLHAEFNQWSTNKYFQQRLDCHPICESSIFKRYS